MSKVAHLVGNGDGHRLYKPAKGIIMTCNLPPVTGIQNVYATAIVDFKMCKAMHEGSVDLRAYDWVMGARPKRYTEMKPDFYMKFAPHIKDFYLVLPKYAANYTDFNCGHMATHYGINKFKPDTVHMYGFDSMFNFDLSSATDFYLESDRGDHNNTRLTNNWRRIWEKMFEEFSDVQIVLHMSDHDNLKFNKGKNVDIKVY